MPGKEHQVIAALRERRSMGKVKSDPVPRELVEQIITAATWAPNHHLTEPWRFVVLVGEARAALGAVMADCLRSRLADPTGSREVALLEKERTKPLRAPVVIAVAAVPSREPGVVESEEVAAVAAAVQNMLLAAEALGLGAIWRTGEAARDPRVREHLGFPAEAHLVAFFYLGYPEFTQRRPRDGDGAAFTTWRG
ncbi:MAG TPA: nitroreductase [Chloroflexota bacterium]|nr:nitroreductase [Chloroflexota bacterium]